MTIRLRPLRADDERAAVAAHEELRHERFPFLLDWNAGENWSTYLARLDSLRRGVDLPEGWVPASFLAAEADGKLVGRVSIRTELNDFLREFGGHIGYAVRPPFRGRGVGSELLRQSLIIARAEGVDPVLVTCDDGNAASRTIIERNGGVLEDVRTGADGVPKRRYWIS